MNELLPKWREIAKQIAELVIEHNRRIEIATKPHAARIVQEMARFRSLLRFPDSL